MEILVVDDHCIIRDGLKKIVEHHLPGVCKVHTADSGSAAVARALEIRPGLIFTDVRMPDFSGIELVAQLKDVLRETHFVIISAYEDFNYAREALRLGAVDYLLKPIGRDDVKRILDRYVTADSRPVQKKIVEDAIKYIRGNYQKDISLTSVANSVSRNYHYFSALFRTETGCNFSDYLRKVRIDKAKELMSDRDSRLSDIARAVGYENYTHFCRNFEKTEGLPPSLYRSRK